METTWGPSGGYGDNRDNTGMTWGQRIRCGDDGDNMGWRPRRQRRPQRPQVMETTWGPSGGYGDNVGMTGTTQGQCGDNMGTTWGRRGQHGDHGDNEITKNAITFERIEIIEFCLKILDP